MSDSCRPRVFYGWWIVAASTLGTALCQSPVVFLTLGVFMIPLGQEFGWDRAEVSLGLSIAALSLALATPVVGRILDRVGARRVILVSMFIYAVATISLYFLTGSIWQFYLALAIVGFTGAGSNTMSYARVLSAWFDRSRGFALGLTMAGIAIGSALAPIIAQTLIDHFSWRWAYAGLGLLVLVIGFPVVFAVIRNRPEEMGLHPDGVRDESRPRPGTAGAADRLGFSRTEAIRRREFWLLIGVFLTIALAMHGVQIHFIPLLRDHGIGAQAAAAAAGIMGVAATLGRVGAGYLFDWFFAPRVAIVLFVASLVGMLLLQVTDNLWLAVLTAVLLGAGAGAESDLMAYLAGRYFGLKSFGELYGYLFSAFMVGTAMGPYAVGLLYELTGTYRMALWLSAGAVGMVVILLASLGPFPRFAREREELAATTPVRA